MLGLSVCHRDPAVAEFGLENVLFSIGHQFIEIVAPVRADCAGARQLARQGGPGGYMVITQCGPHAPYRARASALGVRTVHSFQTTEFIHMQLHPRDTGGSFLEIDEQLGPHAQAPDGPWMPAGSDWRAAPGKGWVEGIAAAAIACTDPDKVAACWAAVTVRPLLKETGHPVLALENARLHFLPQTSGRADALVGLSLATRRMTDILATAARYGLSCGTRDFRLAGINITLV